MSVNERIKYARETTSRTSKQVAEDIGVNPVTYSRYETGKRKPSLDFLEKLTNYYNITLDYFLTKNKSDFGTEQKLSEIRTYMYKRDLLIATLLIASNEYDNADELKKDVADVYINHAKTLYSELKELHNDVFQLFVLESFDEFTDKFFLKK